jgi:hypothetical protein
VPFPSSKDSATEAIKQLTCTLSHPQPAGPCARVDSEQLLALKKLVTTPYRFVMPATPHHMVRRSAAPQNFSKDILEETVQQANHVFYLPVWPSFMPVLLAPMDKQVIIMPEMANAVICPDTGKSLKHHELITLLIYKTQWMILTAKSKATTPSSSSEGKMYYQDAKLHMVPLWWTARRTRKKWILLV